MSMSNYKIKIWHGCNKWPALEDKTQRVQNTNYSCWTNNHVESQLFFSPWYNHHGWLTVKKQLSMYLFPWVSTVFHLDITIMVDWLLKNNYLSIYLSPLVSTVFHPDITIMVDWVLKNNYLSIYLFPWVSTVFHPDITMVDWVLKNNYLSPLVSTVFSP